MPCAPLTLCLAMANEECTTVLLCPSSLHCTNIIIPQITKCQPKCSSCVIFFLQDLLANCYSSSGCYCCCCCCCCCCGGGGGGANHSVNRPIMRSPYFVAINPVKADTTVILPFPYLRSFERNLLRTKKALYRTEKIKQ